MLIYFAGIGFANKTTDKLSEYCPVAHFENAHEHGFITHYTENVWLTGKENNDHSLLVNNILNLFFDDITHIFPSSNAIALELNQVQRFILFRSILI